MLALQACGNREPKRETPATRPEPAFAAELEPMIAQYEDDAIAAGSPVDDDFHQQLVQLVWTDDLGMEGGATVLGRCSRYNENAKEAAERFRVIQIRRPGADGFAGRTRMDAMTLKTIVYHELGHCLHNFHGHRPESSHEIMSTALPQERFTGFPQLLDQHFALMRHPS